MGSQANHRCLPDSAEGRLNHYEQARRWSEHEQSGLKTRRLRRLSKVEVDGCIVVNLKLLVCFPRVSDLFQK